MLAEKTIRKHVVILHAYSLMSVLQRKIVNVLLYEAINGNNNLNNENSVVVECNIPFSNLCKAVKFNSNNTQYLKEAIDGLASLKIEWNLLKDKAPTDISFLNLRVLHGPPTFYQNNTVNFSFHKVMLDFVNNPSVYGTLDIELQSEFESKYSHALYENSTRFVHLQKNKLIELETFRKIVGVSEDKYPSMREFTRNVITPSIDEVNDRANFVVSLETVKSGRKITGFEVSVKNKKRSTITDLTLKTCDNDKIHTEIKQIFGLIKESVLDSILNNYTEDYILEKIAYTLKYAKKENSGLYPIPYFISALKHDYKFKEELQLQNTSVKLLDEKSEWNNKLRLLQSDLNHWKKLFEFHEKENNELQKKNIKSVILKYEEKLKQHILEQSVKNEAV